MSVTSLPARPLIAAVHGLKAVAPRQVPVTITPYELRVAPAGRRAEPGRAAPAQRREASRIGPGRDGHSAHEGRFDEPSRGRDGG